MEIEIREEIQIGNIILEVGDKIQVIEFGPLAGPQRGSQPSKRTDPLDIELRDFINNYLDGQWPQNIKRDRSKGQEIYNMADDLYKSKKISFELLGYLYNLIFS